VRIERSPTASRSIKLLAVALLLVHLSLLAAAPPARAASALWGVNPGLPLLYFQQGKAPLPGHDLQTIHSIGIGQLLADAVWAYAVPSSGSQNWQWGSTDTYVAALAKYQIRWYPRIDYTPSFYSTNPSLIEGGDPQPQYLPQLQAYARALAQRYGPNGDFWRSNRALPYLPVTDYQVWNEPNVPGVLNESGSAGASAYMQMYVAAWQGIHSVDPNATVTFAGLAITGADPVSGGESASAWLAQAVSSAPPQKIDAVGIHPYPYEISINGLIGGVWQQVRTVRQEMHMLNLDATPMQATEFGFASKYAGLASTSADSNLTFTNAQRTQAMKTVALELPHSDCNVDAIVPFAWNTNVVVQDETKNHDAYVYTQYQMVTPYDQVWGQEAQGYQQAIAQSQNWSGQVFRICQG
jgi:hypothetical protein